MTALPSLVSAADANYEAMLLTCIDPRFPELSLNYMRGRGMAYGMRMAAELVGAVIVGGAIGWGLDRWLGSTPWLFLLFFVLGFAAGVLNVVRAYEGMQKEIMARTGGRIGNKVPDDED
jgi:ATP synthase protein I